MSNDPLEWTYGVIVNLSYPRFDLNIKGEGLDKDDKTIERVTYVNDIVVIGKSTGSIFRLTVGNWRR